MCFFRARQALELVFQIKRQPPHNGQGHVAFARPGQTDHQSGRPYIEAFDFRCADAGRELRARFLDLPPDQRPCIVDFSFREVFPDFDPHLRKARPAGRADFLDFGELHQGGFNRLGNQRFDALGVCARKRREHITIPFDQGRVFLTAQREHGAQSADKNNENRQNGKSGQLEEECRHGLSHHSR